MIFMRLFWGGHRQVSVRFNTHVIPSEAEGSGLYPLKAISLHSALTRYGRDDNSIFDKVNCRILHTEAAILL